MRHRKHSHLLGVKTAHREALVANLAAALLRHGKIRTTLAKAKALRPFVERIITLAKKANAAGNPAESLHYRRLAIARVRDKQAVKQLFDERAGEFSSRNGGYTRIYKLLPRLGDAADMAIIELIDASDEGYGKGGRSKRGKAKSQTSKKVEDKVEAEEVEATAEAVESKDSKPTETVDQGPQEAPAEPKSAAADKDAESKKNS